LISDLEMIMLSKRHALTYSDYNIEKSSAPPTGRHADDIEDQKRPTGVKLDSKTVLEIKQRLSWGDKQIDIAFDLGVSRTAVSRIKREITHKETK
jgi:hypothetical protein